MARRTKRNPVAALDVAIFLIADIATNFPEITDENRRSLDQASKYLYGVSDNVKARRNAADAVILKHGVTCGAKKDSFICNRPLGHAGDHWQKHPTSGGKVGWTNETEN